MYEYKDYINQKRGKYMFCPKCGKNLPNGSMFCSGCGKKILDESENNIEIKTINKGLENTKQNSVYHENTVYSITGARGRHIDVYENKGKRGGAYSWGSYGVHPFVLLNHNDTINSMFTLAHEMGHALHSFFTWKKQPYLYADHKIFVAEVASTCNEGPPQYKPRHT